MIAIPLVSRLSAIRLRKKEAGFRRQKAPPRFGGAEAGTARLIDFPAGKALAAVEIDGKTPCADRCFCKGDFALCKAFACVGLWRKDGKDVVFKLVDCPAEGETK